MRRQAIIGWTSVALLVLASAFVAYSVWFCAGALHGDFQGCLASATAEPVIGASFIAGVAGLIFAGMRSRP